jgi:hypothetical protein
MAAFNFRRRRTRHWWYIGATFVAAAFSAVFFVVGAGATLAPSTFEGNDGNLVVNTAGHLDWDNAPNLRVGVDKPTGTSDNSFGQGTKEDNSAVTVVSGSIPNSKADLARFAAAGEVIGGDTWLYIAWSRENQSGTVNFDFELNKVAQPDLTTPGAKTLNRSVNDTLINYAFQGGSNTPTLTKYHWTGPSATGNWVNDGVIGGSCEEGATNGSTVSDTLGGNPPVNRPAQQFGEASINLTCAGIVPQNSCEPFASIYVKSRSSTSFTSEIKDFIAPVTLSANNCGTITVIKHTNPRGLSQSFGYHTTGGLSPATFSLNDTGNSGGGDSTGNTKTYTGVHPGTYTISEDADPFGFAFNNVSCTGGGSDTTTSGRVATIGLQGGENVTCTYTNDQQLGAIKISKTSSKGTALADATFSITGPGSYSNSVQSGADGTVCVDGLVFGTYHVQETAAPSGYDIDDSTSHDVSVNTNTTCSADPYVGATFSATDTPLTDISVNAHAQTANATASKITCTGTSDDGLTSASGSSGSSFTDPADASDTGLHPGTYTCTIVIDP